MDNFSFWQRWLFAIGLILAIFGLALASFNQTPLFDALFNNQINPVFWPAQETTPQVAAFQQWTYGALGATMAGWGIFLAFIAHYPFKNKERWAWNCVLAGMLLWFVIDTALSITFKVYFNVIFNTVILVAVLLPLGSSRKHFTG